MLCSTLIKEKLYIGEATVATLFGVIFGPHAANLIDPSTWGNQDKITLEFSRIVLVVQCFAVGVELPRAYMERHWRSVVFLLIPVMTFGWIMTSLFIWGLMGKHLNFLDSLVCAACVTATDPVLASSVVGKGKFAKRVPKHLRDLLSAESGCNDGMAFPFIYLGIYLVRYRPDAASVTWHWIGLTIFYECIFGAIYGVVVGYLARRAIRYAHEHDLIDRESFLVFYFVLALFCAGSGSILGIDDLLVGFACGVGFSNDGWFLEKTEETHVSNVIDLLINLAFFVYFGTIIPWAHYNDEIIGTSPWRLVIIAILVLLFRRIPIMMVLKPLIPDIKTWREALFAGHFGPIGVGAIFVAILARAELENESTDPLATLPTTGAHANIIQLIWPITTFLVMASILVHGSSIAVFTLGKHINTLTITMSYTQGGEEGKWMDRLPRIASRSKTMSMRKGDDALSEKMPDYPAAALGLPRNFLRRQREEDDPHGAVSRRKKHSNGPIEESAIAPRRRREESPGSEDENSSSDTIAMKSDKTPDSNQGETKRSKPHEEDSEAEVYQEGGDTIIEDEEGNVLEVMESRQGESDAERHDRIGEEVKNLMSDEDVQDGVAQEEHPTRDSRGKEKEKSALDPEQPKRQTMDRKTSYFGDWFDGKSGGNAVQKFMGSLGGGKSQDSRQEEETPPRAEQAHKHRSGPARAYRYGTTIIVEDEDGEVIKKYDISNPDRKKMERNPSTSADPTRTRQRLQRMGTLLGMSGQDAASAATGDRSNSATEAGPSSSTAAQRKKSTREVDDDDNNIRFIMDGQTQRMNKDDFIRQIQGLDPRSRAQVVERSNAPETVKREARADAQENGRNKGQGSKDSEVAVATSGRDGAAIERVRSSEDRPAGPEGLTLVDSHNRDIPLHTVSEEPRPGAAGETAAERRRREAAPSHRHDGNADDDISSEARRLRTQRTRSRSSPTRRPRPEDDETPAERRRREAALKGVNDKEDPKPRSKTMEKEKDGATAKEEETPAERRRREGALGISKEESESEDEQGVRTSRDDDLGPMDYPRGSAGVAARMRRAETLEREEREEGEGGNERRETTTERERERPGIRFADPTPRDDGNGGSSSGGGDGTGTFAAKRLRWGRNKGR